MNSPAENDFDELRRIEKEKVVPLKERSPEFFVRPAAINPDEILARIGITNLPERPKGYLRFLPQDFIVEEVSPEGRLSTIEPEEAATVADQESPTVYADLVKVGIGTPEAVQQAAGLLNINPRQIGYAGLKDAPALTSQRISLRYVPWQQVASLPTGQHIFLKPQSAGKGAVAIGQLSGNRFTMLVRTEVPVPQAKLQRQATALQHDGFANFYGVQRFGNRLLNPFLGKLLCQGNPAEAIKVYLTIPGILDTPIHREVRRQAAERYGAWTEMLLAFDMLPYSFRYERLLLQALSKQTDDWPKILLSIGDQVRFWVYGYASYIVNHLLSRVLGEEVSIPDPLPLPLGGPQTDKLYRAYLTKHQTADYREHLKHYPYIIQKERAISPWITPEIHHVATVSPGSILSFTLPRAAYATTFLMFLFQVYEGTPIPQWVQTDDVDTKVNLGTGSAQQALAQLNVST